MTKKQDSKGKPKSQKSAAKTKASRVKPVTLSQMAELINVSPSAVSKQLQTGALIRSFDGTINILDPHNKEFLKSRGVSAYRVKIPPSRPTGRPVAGPRKPGEITSPSPSIHDAATSELRRTKKIQKCLQLQEKLRSTRAGLRSMSFIDKFATAYLSAWKTEGEKFVDKAVSLIFAHFGTKPTKAQVEKLKAAISREVLSTFQARERIIQNFRKKNNAASAAPAIPAKLQNKAAKVAAPLRTLVEKGFSYNDIEPLLKSDIDRIALLLEIEILKQKVKTSKGELVPTSSFNGLVNQLLEIDGRFTGIAFQLSGEIGEVVHVLDEIKLFEIQNQIWEMSFSPARLVKERINELWT